MGGPRPARTAYDPAPEQPGILVLRRGGRVAAQTAIPPAIGLVLSGLVIWKGGYYLIPVAAVCAALLARAVMAWARCRTEIGPDGIRDQAIRRSETIPWADVARVLPVYVSGTIAVVRRGGGMTKLAGVFGRRPPAHPDLDEIAALIQERIDRHRPDETSRTIPPVIVRRLSWAPVRSILLVLVVLGLVFAMAAVTAPPVALGAVLCLGMAVFICVATVRARTVIAPDGIRNRFLGREVVIPWHDVADAFVSQSGTQRTVKVTRHGGVTTTLAALRDIDVPPDGLGLDDVADVIRQRAGLDAGPEAAKEDSEAAEQEHVDTAGIPAEPMTLRPSRRPLLWVVPLTALLAVGWFFEIRQPGVALISGYLLLGPVCFALLALRLLCGRTDVDQNGLRNRLITNKTTVPWTEVHRFVIAPTLFGRVVQVHRTKGQAVKLAAPREGLLGQDPDFDSRVEAMRALAARHRPTPPTIQRLPTQVTRAVWTASVCVPLVVSAIFWAPWLEPWWPTRHEATTLPRACALLDTPTVGRMVPGASHDIDDHNDYTYSATSTCDLSNDDAASLGVELDLERRSGFDSGSDQAREEFADKKRLVFIPSGEHVIAKEAVGGLGDESWQIVWDNERYGRASVDLLVRRRNVIIEVRHSAERPPSQVATDAQALAQEVLDRIF